MDTILSFPRQFRGPDARPQETLRTVKASGSAAQHSVKVLCSFGGTIGQSPLRLGPYEFDWVKLRGVARKPFHMEPWIAIEELMDRFSPMNESFVP